MVTRKIRRNALAKTGSYLTVHVSIFFAMLQKYHSWLCDVLSSLYINSPIFALNSLGENENIEKKNMIDVPIDEETADMLNIDNNEVMVIPELPS